MYAFLLQNSYNINCIAETFYILYNLTKFPILATVKAVRESEHVKQTEFKQKGAL